MTRRPEAAGALRGTLLAVCADPGRRDDDGCSAAEGESPGEPRCGDRARPGADGGACPTWRGSGPDDVRLGQRGVRELRARVADHRAGWGFCRRLPDRQGRARLQMKTGGGAEPSAGDVLGAVGEAASQLGSFASHLLEDQPGTALLTA